MLGGSEIKPLTVASPFAPIQQSLVRGLSHNSQYHIKTRLRKQNKDNSKTVTNAGRGLVGGGWTRPVISNTFHSRLNYY